MGHQRDGRLHPPGPGSALIPFFCPQAPSPGPHQDQGDQKEKAADSDGQIVASGEIIKFSEPGIKRRHQKSPEHGHIGIDVYKRQVQDPLPISVFIQILNQQLLCVMAVAQIVACALVELEAL